MLSVNERTPEQEYTDLLECLFYALYLAELNGSDFDEPVYSGEIPADCISADKPKDFKKFFYQYVMWKEKLYREQNV